MQIHLSDNIRVKNILTVVCTRVSAGIKPTINTGQKVDQKAKTSFCGFLYLSDFRLLLSTLSAGF